MFLKENEVIICDGCSVAFATIKESGYKKIKKGAMKADYCPSCFADKFPDKWNKIIDFILHMK